MGLFSKNSSPQGDQPTPSDSDHPLQEGEARQGAGESQEQQPRKPSPPTHEEHRQSYEQYRPLSPGLEEADERTRLLISAEDPAINPYNIFWIRTMRRLSLLFAVFAVIMFLLFLISMFFTIPALHTRGGNFLIMMLVLVSIGNLAISLFAFGIPSKSERIVNWMMMAFLLIDLIFIVSAPKLRNYEGNVLGILIMLWTIFSAGWVLACNLAVERSRRGLEERLIGHRLSSSRAQRSCRQWCSVMWELVVFIVLLVLVVLITLTLAVDTYDSRVSPPGQYVNVQDGFYRVHVFCNRPQDKRGDPTIFIEPGSTSSEVLAHEWLKREIDDDASPIYNYRYCYWDRPGMAFSDNAPSPMSASMAIDALSDALSQLRERGPWILVSHGVGGIYSRVFASRHAGDVDGLVLVDTYHEDYFTSTVGSSGRGFAYWIHGFVSPLGIDKHLGWIFGGRTSRDRIYGRSQATSGKFNLAKFQEQVAARTFTKYEIIAARDILPMDTPIAVISSQEMIRSTEGWADYQRQISEYTHKLRNWSIVEAPHEVWRAGEGRRQMSSAVADLAKKSKEAMWEWQ
ncbi:hypothetical protein POJ06DRAFT_261947 [Lipomyces tetrasporus]|uniref:AB hydrolase-1 domain-containing protein n=1 Tax=Lipomyces tetrasporus TaxID=54092 RepID=A0AAD7QLR9_9ASCO|nr:uncharacterized protein POJ06DRAFT_261947 [Lipomyces tetrasporus]KAJ8097632.1 hypothetical protein POJ06DRAFT_261947 [Lipomyces tetrasporus]